MAKEENTIFEDFLAFMDTIFPNSQVFILTLGRVRNQDRILTLLLRISFSYHINKILRALAVRVEVVANIVAAAVATIRATLVARAVSRLE